MFKLCSHKTRWNAHIRTEKSHQHWNPLTNRLFATKPNIVPLLSFYLYARHFRREWCMPGNYAVEERIAVKTKRWHTYKVRCITNTQGKKNIEGESERAMKASNSFYIRFFFLLLFARAVCIQTTICSPILCVCLCVSLVIHFSFSMCICLCMWHRTARLNLFHSDSLFTWMILLHGCIFAIAVNRQFSI